MIGKTAGAPADRTMSRCRLASGRQFCLVLPVWHGFQPACFRLPKTPWTILLHHPVATAAGAAMKPAEREDIFCRSQKFPPFCSHSLLTRIQIVRIPTQNDPSGEVRATFNRPPPLATRRTSRKNVIIPQFFLNSFPCLTFRPEDDDRDKLACGVSHRSSCERCRE